METISSNKIFHFKKWPVEIGQNLQMLKHSGIGYHAHQIVMII